MSKKSCQTKKPRIPSAYNGIQVNCCKNTKCENFGLTPEQAHKTEVFKKYNENNDDRQVRDIDPFYIISGGHNKIASIKCKACAATKNDDTDISGQVFYILKSNQAVHEEYTRLRHYLIDPSDTCSNIECSSHKFPESNDIKKRGYTAAGIQRYHCNVCNTSYTGAKINRQHLRTEIDKTFFKLLVSQVSFKRIEYILGIDYRTLSRRIDFLHRQCLAFVSERERKLISMASSRMYLATDRQIQKSNWTNRKEKLNCEFYGIGTADLASGYVLAFSFNYDPSMDPEEIETAAANVGDQENLKHNRKYARVWLKSDFEDAKKNSSRRPDLLAGSLEESISMKSFFGTELDAEQSSEYYDHTKRAPLHGMEVHNEYTMAAHFYLIKQLTRGVEKTRFYLDQDSGMKTWYTAAFKEEITKGDSDGFMVTMKKDLTVESKRNYADIAKRDVANFAGRQYGSMSQQEIRQYVNKMIVLDMQSPFVTEKTKEKWIKNPMPSIAEPSKMIHAFTPIERYDLEHQANLYRKGSLHAIDRFFMQIRRKVRMFERPIKSGTNKMRVWNGYSPYNPENYQKLADIFRVFYNYCQPYEKTKDTPAMRLGLAKGVVDIEKVIYFKKY